jgi:hypothetical protein
MAMSRFWVAAFDRAGLDELAQYPSLRRNVAAKLFAGINSKRRAVEKSLCQDISQVNRQSKKR